MKGDQIWRDVGRWVMELTLRFDNTYGFMANLSLMNKVNVVSLLGVSLFRVVWWCKNLVIKRHHHPQLLQKLIWNSPVPICNSSIWRLEQVVCLPFGILIACLCYMLIINFFVQVIRQMKAQKAIIRRLIIGLCSK